MDSNYKNNKDFSIEQQDFSLMCEKLKRQIIELLNSNNLPPIIKYYIIKDINTQVENTYINYINIQLQQETKQKKEETGIE